MSTTHTAASVDTMVAFANRIWRQANIEWYVESVLQEEAPTGHLLDSIAAGLLPSTHDRLWTWLPRNRLLLPGWNAFLIQDFGRVGGGVFLVEAKGILLAQRGFGYELPANGRGGGTLAHELGHSLTLPHVVCDSTRNIMANGCSAPGVVSSLTPAQVVQSRRQAISCRPADVGPGP